MFCSKCGKQLLDGSVFCDKCGQKVKADMSTPVTEESEETNTEHFIPTAIDNNIAQSQIQINTSVKKRPIVPIAIAAAIVAALCAVLCLIFIGNKSVGIKENAYTKTGSLVLVYDSNQKITRIVYNDALLDDYLQGDESNSSCESSLDGNTYAINSKDRTLYIIDGQGVKTVAYDVHEFSLSYNGKGLIYSDTEENLFIYDCVKNEKTRISNNRSGRITYLCISPDGQSAAYTEYSDGEYVMYSYVENEKQKVGKNILPLALSDNAANYFVCDSNPNYYYSSLYYMDSYGEKEKIASLFTTVECILNKNNTEIIFYDGDWSDNGRYYYFSSSSGEKIMLFDKERSSYDFHRFPSFIYPNDTLFREYSVYYGSGVSGSGFSKIVSSESLRSGAVYLYEEDTSNGSCNLITVDSKGEKKKMRINPIDDFNNYYFNGNVLSYGGHIYKYDSTTEEIKGIYSIDFDTCDNLIVSNGGKTIYYTRNGQVYCAHDAYGNGKYEERKLDISHNVDSMILLKGRYLLLSGSNKVYISDDGDKPIETLMELPSSFLFNKIGHANYIYVNSMVYSEGGGGVYSEHYSKYESNVYILKPNGEKELVAENGNDYD